MSLRPLTHADIEVETCCFVCDPRNESGLHLQFFVDEKANRVVADYTPSASHEGPPGATHGGVLSAILDDAMAWAVNELIGTFGVTRRVVIEYDRIVRTGEPHSISARIIEMGSRRAAVRAELRDADNQLCCSTRGEFVLLPSKDVGLAFKRRSSGAKE